MVRLAAVAFTVNELPAPMPDELAFIVTGVLAEALITTVPVEVAVMDVAVVGLAAETLIPAVPAVRFAIGAVSVPVVWMPLPTLVALSVKEGAELAFNEMTPPALLAIETVPVEVTVRLFVFIELAPAKVMPLVPVVRLTEVAVNVPLDVSPLPAPEAFKVNADAVLLLSAITPAAVSVIEIAPAEFAWRVLADVLAMVLPAAPAVIIREPVLSPVPTLVDVTEPATADNVSDVEAV